MNVNRDFCDVIAYNLECPICKKLCPGLHEYCNKVTAMSNDDDKTWYTCGDVVYHYCLDEL